MVVPAHRNQVGAVVLAAGLSSRMGRPKMVLPWKNTTIIGQVVDTIFGAGINNVFVVIGGANDVVINALKAKPVVTVFNPDYENGEMLFSIQAGLSQIPNTIHSALIVLGDQPQIEIQIVNALLDLYEQEGSSLIIPSYQMRRGHPWLVARPLWNQILALRSPLTLRDFLEVNQGEIRYLNVSTPTVLQDMDTPDDYEKYTGK